MIVRLAFGLALVLACGAEALAQERVTRSFFPLDSVNHNTVLSMFNPGPGEASVTLRARDANGTECGDTLPLSLAAGATVRITADSLVAGSPPSWDDAMLFDPGDFCPIGLVTAPAQVALDGYLAWSATSEYDPRAQQPRSPLRFSVESGFLELFSDGFEGP